MIRDGLPRSYQADALALDGGFDEARDLKGMPVCDAGLMKYTIRSAIDSRRYHEDESNETCAAILHDHSPIQTTEVQITHLPGELRGREGRLGGALLREGWLLACRRLSLSRYPL